MATVTEELVDRILASIRVVVRFPDFVGHGTCGFCDADVNCTCGFPYGIHYCGEHSQLESE